MGNAKGVKRDFAKLQNRRFRAANLFDRGYSKSEGAQRFGVSAQSTSRWYAAWQANGNNALKQAGRAGRMPRLNSNQIHQLEQALLQGPQAIGYKTPVWSATRVVDLIHRQTGIRYHPDHIYRLLPKLTYRCKHLVGRTLERDERIIRG